MLLEPVSDAAFVLVPGGGVEPPRGVNLGGFWVQPVIFPNTSFSICSSYLHHFKRADRWGSVRSRHDPVVRVWAEKKSAWILIFTSRRMLSFRRMTMQTSLWKRNGSPHGEFSRRND